MNEIHKKPLTSIGYDFINDQFIPEGKDEYYLRNQQNKNGIRYRHLTAYEIEVLVRNNNTSDDWNKIQVSDAFNPELVKNCKFFGLVRIGKLEPMALEYHNVRMPVGLYNSTIISCDFGDNVIINNVNYISHYIIGSEVMIANVHELHCTNHSKFGNGIIKDDESEDVRIWLEVCNENGGRKILPFNGMLPGDAYLWAKYRDNEALQNKFKDFTEKKFNKLRGYYGKVGDRCVIKNTSIIKDVWVGSDAYIKGANKLKNLTIKSSPEAPTQIGEGCELVNGIVDEGCRIFYGVKAVRFLLASHSQLKYGARLINSYLGNNSTISCCEVLNSLIFPAHEQHHNNSFLCAALVMGQSNIAAGATIGSNHNSRAADGEVVAARGFWPALCVSLKHNSRFASFTLLARGDYPYELDIRLPFSLVSIDAASDKLQIMPAYWFMYNMYALARNSYKHVDRDNRIEKEQLLDFDFLAPDTVNEMFSAIAYLKNAVSKAYNDETDVEVLLSGAGTLDREIIAEDFECSNRTVQLLKVKEAYHTYRRMIVYYGVQQLMNYADAKQFSSVQQLLEVVPSNLSRAEWLNIGGQLIPRDAVNTLISEVTDGSREGWEDVHSFYSDMAAVYPDQNLQHAFAALLELLSISKNDFTPELFSHLLDEALSTKEWMVHNIHQSRAKDYQNEFRKMVYDSVEEMERVIGKLDENTFILQQQAELDQLQVSVSDLKQRFAL